MATLIETLASDMQAAIADYEQVFTWRGFDYPCVINSTRSAIIVAKSLFNPGEYPIRGEGITVAGATRQVLALNNSHLNFAPGGFIESIPFVDDPADPALVIEFGKVISQ